MEMEFLLFVIQFSQIRSWNGTSCWGWREAEAESMYAEPLTIRKGFFCPAFVRGKRAHIIQSVDMQISVLIHKIFL